MIQKKNNAEVKQGNHIKSWQLAIHFKRTKQMTDINVDLKKTCRHLFFTI